MIPILYESDEINFISNGIGRLRDCIRCEVTEERNGIYECEFEYPVTGQHFDDIKCGRIIAVEHDEKGDVQPFDIISYTRPLNGVVTFHAQHISYRQKGITVIANSSSSGETTRSAFAKIKSGSPSNPFNYYSDMSGQHIMAAFDLTPRSARQLLGGIEGSILDAFGGEYEWDKFNVNLWKSRGTEKDYTIRYGVNLLDFQEEFDTSEAYNACIPYWKGEDDLVLADPAMITAGESYSGRINCAPLDLTDKFEEKPTQQQVTDAGISYMSSNRPYLPSQTINVNFVRLQDSDEYDEYAALQKCSLCDSVKVVFPMYGVTGSFKIVKVVWDVLLERYIEMDLGNLYTTLSQALGIGGIQASADQANRNVAGAWGTAADAQATASAASQAASAAQASATSASEAATNAWNHADEAHQAATAAQGSATQAYYAAEEAKESARSANNSANNALIQLSVVEDVAGTLRWISEHGDYVLTTDTTVHSDTVYFVYQFGDYVPIANPPAGSNPAALGWYVLDVSKSQSDYIMSHLAVTSAGLWVLPVDQLSPHELVDSQGNQLVDSSNNPIVDFSSDPQNATGYKVLLSGGGGQTGDFPIGMTIYNDEGEPIANYGTTTTIGAASGKHIYIDTDSVDIMSAQNLLATFGQEAAIYSTDGTEIAHFGYGLGASSSGTAVAPYYTFGVRSANSTVGNYSLVGGYDNTASGFSSVALGRESEATAAYAIAAGYDVEASDLMSIALGYGTKAESSAQVAMGFYNEADPNNTYALIIGDGSSDNSRHNAFTVSNRGDVVCNSMDSGIISAATFGSVSAGSYKDYSLSFNKTFTSTPVVTVSFFSDSTAPGLGNCSVSVHSTTTSGCKVRIFNNDSSTRNPAVSWIAMLT